MFRTTKMIKMVTITFYNIIINILIPIGSYINYNYI